MHEGQTILITGGSGFVGSHCVAKALEAGYAVRTTLRNSARAAAVHAMLETGTVADRSRLTFVEADLERDEGWPSAATGCEYVLHVASPFPSTLPRTDDELVIPARDGTLRVLRAARDAGVRRVVLTSSFAAIGYGHPERATPFDESCWTDLSGPGVGAYVKSKTVAERAAWDFVANAGNGLELSVVNPVAIFGPVLGADYSTSILVVQRMMSGKLPGCPRLRFGVVDVRDVAALHLLAMTHPDAKGERFLAVAGDFLWMSEMARLLKRRLGTAASKVRPWELPNWMVRLACLFDPAIEQILPDLGRSKNATSAKAQRLLGWKPRTAEEALVATAESLQRLGLLER